MFNKIINKSIKDHFLWVVIKIRIDKFFIDVFNLYIYNYGINVSLAANVLSPFPKYYSLEKTIKNVNFWDLKKEFSKIILDDNLDKDIVKSLILFGRLKTL